jgi:hypothetical protein
MLDKKETYKVVEFVGDLVEFEKLVNVAMEDEFRPIGSVAVFQQQGRLKPTYYQSMIKKEVEKKTAQVQV